MCVCIFHNLPIKFQYLVLLWLPVILKPLCVVVIIILYRFSYHDTKSVFLALGITVIVCIAVTVFCFQTKVHHSEFLNLYQTSKVYTTQSYLTPTWSFLYVCLIWKTSLLLNLPSGGFHQMRGLFLCAGNCLVCDWHHHYYCAVNQICKWSPEYLTLKADICMYLSQPFPSWSAIPLGPMASHAVCCLWSYCVHSGEFNLLVSYGKLYCGCINFMHIEGTVSTSKARNCTNHKW